MQSPYSRGLIYTVYPITYKVHTRTHKRTHTDTHTHTRTCAVRTHAHARRHIYTTLLHMRSQALRICDRDADTFKLFVGILFKPLPILPRRRRKAIFAQGPNNWNALSRRVSVPSERKTLIPFMSGNTDNV